MRHLSKRVKLWIALGLAFILSVIVAGFSGVIFWLLDKDLIVEIIEFLEALL
jgi:hypothetical protein